MDEANVGVRASVAVYNLRRGGLATVYRRWETWQAPGAQGGRAVVRLRGRTLGLTKLLSIGLSRSYT